MIHDLSSTHTIVSQYLTEIRDQEVQQDRLRFRTNIRRIGWMLAYEASKSLPYIAREVRTPLGTAQGHVLPQQPVLGAILRAGLALHEGASEVFDHADHAFISAYRKHSNPKEFDIELQYLACPDLEGRTLIMCDPMIATGESMLAALRAVQGIGTPDRTIVLSVISSTPGLAHLTNEMPELEVYCGGIDETLNDYSYIVPGIGDAGDLAYGPKLQR